MGEPQLSLIGLCVSFGGSSLSAKIFRTEGLLSASVFGQIILVIYNMSDTLFVGMTKSDEMITAVTVCMPAFMFLSAISNLFGVGASSVIARALGRGESDKAKYTSSFAIWGCIIVTVLYSLGVGR